MFPEELPRRLIKMFSFVEDIVLDPFLGSGTTVLQASTRVPQKVFTVFSSGEKGEKKLHNPEVIEEIRTEIERLKSCSNFNS